jgi:uncharacterized protein (TIGR04255 family)
MVVTSEGPFGRGTIEEVHLPRAPLVAAIAQIRFPKSPELASDAYLARVRERLKAVYPILREERTVSILVGSPAVQSGPPADRIWRFKSRDETWQVSLSETFAALDTSAYKDREDFCSRFDEVVETIAQVLAPPMVDRLGLRYHNRLAGESLSELDRFVSQPLLGLSQAVAEPAKLLQSLTQAQFRLDDIDIVVRHGLLPANAIVDPSFKPMPEPTWMLDLDVYKESKRDFTPSDIGQDARRFADIAYRFFRWATTDVLVARSRDAVDL